MNKTISYDNIKTKFEQLTDPFKLRTDEIEKGFIDIGFSGTVYTESIAKTEGFLRLLWGYAYYYVEHEYDDFFYSLLEGIKSGTDSNHAHYWGDFFDYTQVMVEIAPLSVFLIEHRDIILSSFNDAELERLRSWIASINEYKVHQNNWLFFRVLANVSLRLVFDEDNLEQIDADLDILESFYIGDGWYYDGREKQIDYYIAFAFHYYSILYAVYFESIDARRSELFKSRAVKFASDFQSNFDNEGRAIPYGRSLIYRFAQGSFWSAMLWAGLDSFPIQDSMAILTNHLDYWFKQNIFDNAGYLNLGYSYQNLRMTEEYNGPGSPYWALKSFIVLAIPKNNTIWNYESIENNKPLSTTTPALVIKNVGTSVKGYPKNIELYHHIHGKAKYERFVYASNFGFNIPLANEGGKGISHDNCFMVSECDGYYRSQQFTETTIHEHGVIQKEWDAWRDVSISTWIVPGDYWHIRIHRINTARPLSFIDSGFSVPYPVIDRHKETNDEIAILSNAGTSAIHDITQLSDINLSETVVNSNILNPRVVFPYFSGELEKGEHLLVHAFYGDDSNQIELNQRPQCLILDSVVRIQLDDKMIVVDLDK